MFYIKLFSDVLKDTSLNLLDKVVLCHLIEIWENNKHIVSTVKIDNQEHYEMHDNHYIAIIKLSISNAARELNISRASYYRCLDKLINVNYIELVGCKGQFTLIRLFHKCIDGYMQLNKIVGELSQKWKKKDRTHEEIEEDYRRQMQE